MKSFTDLDAWKFGIELVKEIYGLTATFPADEQYGMTRQLRKSVTSTTANIAEGCGRYSYDDKANKFVIARGECIETEAFLLMSIAVHYVTEERAQRALDLTRKVGRMISGLIASCKQKSKDNVNKH